MNNNAVRLVEEIVKIARANGQRMIDYYNEHGRGISLVPTKQCDNKRLRFASLQMDHDL
jgi:hypothetical protein